MFRKIHKTVTPPNEKPMMVWDGECNFCRYWITVLRHKTGDKVMYQPYQEVTDYFPDISASDFGEAVRLVEKDGSVYNGPDSAYRIFYYLDQPVRFAHRWYCKSRVFSFISDYAYHFISSNRSLMLTLTRMMWGSNPLNRKPYWLIYLIAILIPLVLLLV